MIGVAFRFLLDVKIYTNHEQLLNEKCPFTPREAPIAVL